MGLLRLEGWIHYHHLECSSVKIPSFQQVMWKKTALKIINIYWYTIRTSIKALANGMVHFRVSKAQNCRLKCYFSVIYSWRLIKSMIHTIQQRKYLRNMYTISDYTFSIFLLLWYVEHLHKYYEESCVSVVWGTKILLFHIEAFLKSTTPAVSLLYSVCIFKLPKIKG
jgi:hypothetical protein